MNSIQYRFQRACDNTDYDQHLDLFNQLMMAISVTSSVIVDRSQRMDSLTILNELKFLSDCLEFAWSKLNPIYLENDLFSFIMKIIQSTYDTIWLGLNLSKTQVFFESSGQIPESII